MSEFLADALVRVRPDTTAFRTQLEAQLLAATRGVVIPIKVTPVAATGVAAAASATQTFSQASSAATRESLALAGAQKTLAASTAKSTSELLGASSATSRLDAALLGLRTAVGSSAVIGLGALALAAIAAGQAIRGMLIQTAEFQQELATFRATTGATAEEMQRVAEAARALGADVTLPAVSAADAAVAMTELAKAGLTVEESIDGAVGVLQLATAAQLSNADAAKIAANALNSFGLAGAEATRVADDFANAANAAQGSVADIGIALQQASAVARQVGLSLEDTVSILSLFAKNGLAGSDAGTSLRVALIRLVAPTQQAAAEIKKLGLDIRDAQGDLRPDIFAQFGQATRNLSPAVRDASAALIFGQDAIRAVAIGAREGTEGLRLMQFEIDQQGTAAEVSAARTEGLAGAFSAMQSNLQTLGVELGSIVAGPLTVFLKSISDAISTTTLLIGNLSKLGKIKIPPFDIDIGIHIDFGGRTGAVGDIAGQVKDVVGNAVGQAVAQVVVSPATTSALRAKAFVTALAQLSKGADSSKAKIAGLNEELRAFQKARVAAEKGGDTAVADRLTQRIESLKNQINALKNAGKGVSESVAKPLQESVTILQKLRETARGEDIPFINSLIRSLQRSIPITVQTEGNIARLRDEMGALGFGSNAAAAGVDALTASLTALSQQSAAASDALLKLQNEGASPRAQISNLQNQKDIQEGIIANLKANGIQAGDTTRIRAARNEINRINSQIESLQNQIASDAREAAGKAKTAAEKAQKARDEQFAAIAETFGGRQENIENQIERAGIADNIAKQIRLSKALLASLLKERKVLLDRLKTLQVSNAVRKQILQAITRAIEDAQQDILRLNKEQADRIKDFATPAIDLRIRIAQARDNVAQEIRLRRQRLALITNELIKLKHAGQKNTLAWLELKAQQAEEAAAIRDLEKQTRDKNKDTRSLFFAFLQAQEGFAANLLGNLIPGFATRGLVGNAAPAAGQGFEQLGVSPQQRASQAADVGASVQRGVKPVQVDTTNHILRQILAAIQGRHTQPPEIAHNRGAGGASFDIL